MIFLAENYRLKSHSILIRVSVFSQNPTEIFVPRLAETETNLRAYSLKKMLFFSELM